MSDPLSPVILNKVAALPLGGVKSVQRGKVFVNNVTKAVTISTVDPNKCLVDVITPSNATNYSKSAVESLTATVLTLTPVTDSGSSVYVHWQIVEFY